MKVNFTYFKKLTGKYYSSGELEMPGLDYHEIIRDAKDRMATGELPGLVPGHSDFHVLVEAGGVPHLLVSY